MRFDNIPREVWFGIIVLFLLGMRFPPLIGLLLIMGMVYFSQSMMNGFRSDRDETITERRDRGRYYSYEEPRELPARPTYVDVQPVAVAERTAQVDPVARAIANAGQNVDDLTVLPLDLGVLAYKDNELPQIYRLDDLPDDIDYIQPFVELELPAAVTGRVRFELVDGSGRTVFVEEMAHRFHEGAQPVVAQTRLPIHDTHNFNDAWHLRIYAEDMLLADHPFAWNNAVNVSPIRQHLQEDGEMSPELREVLADSRLERMSLDELLDFQEDESASEDAAALDNETQRQARRRS